MPGHKEDYIFKIQLTGDTIPQDLKEVELGVRIAGRWFSQTFNPLPDLSYTFIWDGKDAYGRVLQGEHPVTVWIGYVYPAVYQEPAELEQSFALFSGVPMTANRTRQEITLWQVFRDTLGTFKGADFKFGGWTLNVHHFYHPAQLVLYTGDGQRRHAETLSLVINSVEDFSTPFPADVVGPDGSVYLYDEEHHVILRVATDGTLTTVAGTGIPGFSGDGGPATQAQLDTPVDVEVAPDGSFYIADFLQ